MLLWEILRAQGNGSSPVGSPDNGVTLCSLRLPYDKRCTARTKHGTRCRGRIQPGKDFCLFHDPEMTAERRRKMAARAGETRRRLSHLPGGYLRKLTTAAAVGQAMDRLYREVRLGVVTPDMGNVLFGILTRLWDSGLVATGPRPERTKAARLRPRLRDLLTRAERAAWEKAVANATPVSPPAPREPHLRNPYQRALSQRRTAPQPAAAPSSLTLQAAS